MEESRAAFLQKAGHIRLSGGAADQVARPSPQRTFGKTERISLALAHAAYQSGTVRLASTDLRGYSHIVASRQGLFAVNESSLSLIVDGLFFGITLRGPSIYVFEACDLPRNATGRGRVIELFRSGDAIVRARVIATGLDNGCHQIDFIDNRLCILDTYNQRILRSSADEKTMECLHPLPRVENRDWLCGYAHVNSLLQVEDKLLL
jgi:hypothetical protein